MTETFGNTGGDRGDTTCAMGGIQHEEMWGVGGGIEGGAATSKARDADAAGPEAFDSGGGTEGVRRLHAAAERLCPVRLGACNASAAGYRAPPSAMLVTAEAA